LGGGCGLAVLLSACSVGAPEPKDADSGGGSPVLTVIPKPVVPAPPVNLTPADLRVPARGSARAALLEFWYFVQYREMNRAYLGLSQRVRTKFARSLRHFQTYVVADGDRWLGKPNVLFEDGTARRRTLVVVHARPQAAPEREAITFVRENGAWKLDYSFYLATRMTAK
jgi:hypothetical protein